MREKSRAQFEASAVAFKRIANILAQAQEKGIAPMGFVPGRVREPAEKELAAALQRSRERVQAAIDEREDYLGAYSVLAELRPVLDEFFEKVLVMDKDPALRDNRLALLRALHEVFAPLADFAAAGGEIVLTQGGSGPRKAVRMKLAPALFALLFLGCGAPPLVLPPPFGQVGNQTPRLFFPTGMAVTGDGGLLVANGNYNHAFEAGTMVSLDPAWINSLYARGLRCEKPINNGLPAQFAAGCDDPIPTAAFRGIAMIGNYAGLLTLELRGERLGRPVVSLANARSQDQDTGHCASP